MDISWRNFYEIEEDLLVESGGIFSMNFEYPAEFPYSPVLRSVLKYLLQQYNISNLWQTRLVLVLDELVNNAIEHGSKLWDKNVVYLTLQKKSDGIDFCMQVEDSWTSHFSIEELNSIIKERVESPVSIKEKRGRWMKIIHKLVDDFSFSREWDKTRAVVRKKILFQ